MAARRVAAASANWASQILRYRGAGSSSCLLENQATLRSYGLCNDNSLTGSQSFASGSLQHYSNSALPEAQAGSAPASSGNNADAEVAQPQAQHKKVELLAAFTCNKCGARTARGFSKVAYEKGVVIARCGQCDVQHLLSDQLGWFGEKGNIEDILAEKGQGIRKYVDGNDVLQLTPEDLEGWSEQDPKAVASQERKQ